MPVPGLGLLCVLGSEKARDQIARDDKEDVDAREAAVESPDVEVVEDHQENGDRTQAFDVGAKPNQTEALIEPVSWTTAADAYPASPYDERQTRCYATTS